MAGIAMVDDSETQTEKYAHSAEEALKVLSRRSG
jgi:hypothetical protein